MQKQKANFDAWQHMNFDRFQQFDFIKHWVPDLNSVKDFVAWQDHDIDNRKHVKYEYKIPATRSTPTQRINPDDWEINFKATKEPNPNNPIIGVIGSNVFIRKFVYANDQKEELERLRESFNKQLDGELDESEYSIITFDHTTQSITKIDQLI